MLLGSLARGTWWGGCILLCDACCSVYWLVVRGGATAFLCCLRSLSHDCSLLQRHTRTRHATQSQVRYVTAVAYTCTSSLLTTLLVFIFFFKKGFHMFTRPLRGCTETDDVTFEIYASSNTDWRLRHRGQQMNVRIVWTDYELALLYWCSHVEVTISCINH